MELEEKINETQSLVDEFIEILNKKNTDPSVAMAVGGQFFGCIANDCNLSKEQFLYLCQGIADKNSWKNDGSKKVSE